MRVLVTGGRNYNNAAFFYQFMEALHKKVGITALIEGGASGADRMAATWADAENLPHLIFKADWDNVDVPGAYAKVNNKTGLVYNAMAGFQRNQDMIDDGKPDLCIACPGGSGTADMVRRCKKAGIKVIELNR
jgi:hypothetical protein